MTDIQLRIVRSSLTEVLQENRLRERVRRLEELAGKLASAGKSELARFFREKADKVKVFLS